jgi:hypothetical protein
MTIRSYISVACSEMHVETANLQMNIALVCKYMSSYAIRNYNCYATQQTRTTAVLYVRIYAREYRVLADIAVTCEITPTPMHMYGTMHMCTFACECRQYVLYATHIRNMNAQNKYA